MLSTEFLLSFCHFLLLTPLPAVTPNSGHCSSTRANRRWQSRTTPRSEMLRCNICSPPGAPSSIEKNRDYPESLSSLCPWALQFPPRLEFPFLIST